MPHYWLRFNSREATKLNKQTTQTKTNKPHRQKQASHQITKDSADVVESQATPQNERKLMELKNLNPLESGEVGSNSQCITYRFQYNWGRLSCARLSNAFIMPRAKLLRHNASRRDFVNVIFSDIFCILQALGLNHAISKLIFQYPK